MAVARGRFLLGQATLFVIVATAAGAGIIASGLAIAVGTRTTNPIHGIGPHRSNDPTPQTETGRFP
jgi:hypothetical protein